MNGMTSVAFCASSPVKSCRVQIIISPSIANIPSSSLKLSDVSRVPLIKFCFLAISWHLMCHIVSNCLWCTHACTVTCTHTLVYMHKQGTTWRIGTYRFTITTQKGFVQYSLQMFRRRRSQLRNPVCWFSITGASVRERARTRDTSCHVLIQLLWNSKYPCLFVLLELHIHHNYVN